MATKQELSEMLLKRFKGVPNVTAEDADDWIERSMLEHDYLPDQEVPQNMTLLVLLYAEWDACIQFSLKAGHFFQYKDAEETVDKRAISEQYRRIASELKKRYNERKATTEIDGQGGVMFYTVRRVDRT